MRVTRSRKSLICTAWPRQTAPSPISRDKNMEELRQTIEGAPGGDGGADRELLSFWDHGNLKKIFEAEDKIGAEVYKKIKDIDKNYNADRDVIKFSLGLSKGKQEKFVALEADRDKKIYEALAPFHGRFLEKL